MGIDVHNKIIRGKGIKYQWFCQQGEHMPLDSPSSIQGMEKLQPLLQLQAFDVFIHVFYPAAGHSSQSEVHTRQLWVWVPEAFWKLVTIGYICPGPGILEGRHLMITDQGEPTWITGSTRYRRYKAVHHPSTASHSEVWLSFHVGQTC